MTMRRAQSLAATLLAAGVLGCGAGGGAGTSSSGGGTPAAAVPDLSGYIPYEPMTVDSTVGTSTTAVACTNPTATATGTALTADASGSGVFSVLMVDAPNPEVREIWVSIESVSVHVVGLGWIPLTNTSADPEAKIEYPVMVDLLKLQNYAMPLGFATIPAGTVTQIRLVVTPDVSTGRGVGTDTINYVVLEDGTVEGKPVALKTPSGYESGLKIMGPWHVKGCTKTEVTIDFDGKKSIWYHPTGQGTEWILRPVIRVKGVVTGPIACSGTGGNGGSGDTGKGPGSSCSVGTECASGSCVENKCTAPGGTPLPPTNPPLPIGESCSVGTECASGFCVDHKCSATGETPVPPPVSPPTNQPIGAGCSAGTECTSGTCTAGVCTAGGAGAQCTLPAECLSNSCRPNHTCAVSPVGGQCNKGTDCGTGLCDAGSCVNTPTTTPSPVGTACILPAECMSNQCLATGGSAATCQPGVLGSPCDATSACSTGLQCVTDKCSVSGAGVCQWINRMSS